MNTVLDRLQDARVMMVSIIGKRQFRFWENCDGYFYEDLTREDVLQLADELKEMAGE